MSKFPTRGESDTAQATAAPVTRSMLAADLERLGLERGAVVLVHCSLSRLGWVAGGAQAVIEALLDVIGRRGTLVMPTHSTQLTEPSHWRNPPVPAHWWPVLRAELPAFDAHLTPTRVMGVVAETFRKLPQAVRSSHPHGSFTACGPKAASITQVHPVDCIFGEHSPVARLYALDACILLLGVDHGNNTSLHLAEYRARYPNKRTHREGAPVLVEGVRRWVEFDELVLDDADFGLLGDAFARATGAERRGPVGSGEARLMSSRAVIDYAVGWFEAHR
jgi:aminoglycoside 3-N-acetyltransferase